MSAALHMHTDTWHIVDVALTEVLLMHRVGSKRDVAATCQVEAA
jgi:hypothetical protein